MCLNSQKCKMMSVDRSNLYGVYILVISRDLKPHDQVCKAASPAKRMLVLLRNTFCFKRSNSSEKTLYNICQTSLGICSSRLEPIHKKNCQVLKKDQRNATKISHFLKKLSYEKRLTNLGLTTLEVR